MDRLLLTKRLRCRGAVIYDKFYGPHEKFWGWKCLICGEIVDPVILENRQLMRAGQGINLRRASGLLQEKRENLLRITQESVLNLGRKVIGDNADVANIYYFIQVEV